jgi:peptide/nickel transport system permease protein
VSVASTTPYRRSGRRGVSSLRSVVSRPGAVLGLGVVLGLVVVAVFAPLLAPYDPAAQNVADRLQSPSGDHLLGTDELGRDLLSRLLFGTRIALGVAVPAVLAALAFGIVLGTIAGYVGGWIDNVLVVVMDTLQAFPAVVLALALLAVLGPSLRNVIIVISVSFTPAYARVVRALVLAIKELPFVEAERALGARGPRIVLAHVLPNVFAPLFILLAMDIPGAITIEAGVSFLGLGVQPPAASWGVILADGFDRVRDTPWPIISAGAALVVATLGFTMLGEMLRDEIDPRVSGLRRWRRVL